MKIRVIVRIFIIQCLSSLTLVSFAQNDYTVIKVYGTIVYKKMNRDLEKGDQFKDKDILLFKTTESKAAVISPVKGRLMLTNTSANNPSAMNFVPGMSNISSRGININSSTDIDHEFSGKCLLINSSRLAINKSIYPQNDENFFYIQFKYNNEEINKKLSHNGDTMIIDKKELLQVDKKPITLSENYPMKLYYYKNKTSELICDFTMVMPDEQALRKEIMIISDTYNNKEIKFIQDEIKAYLTEYYGKPNDVDLSNWLYNLLQLR